MYEVLIERSVERDLKSLPTPLFHRIVSRIRALAEPAGEFLSIRKHFERSKAIERLERMERVSRIR